MDCPIADFSGRFWNDYQALIPGLVESPAHPRRSVNFPAPEMTRNPYRGLKPYLQDHWTLFHGRANEVSELRDLLAGRPHGLIPIIGPSGSGKSSLVRAGLFNRLRLNGIESSGTWKTVDLTLSQHRDDEGEGQLRPPLQALARSILPKPSAHDTSEDTERRENEAAQLVYDLKFNVSAVVTALLKDAPATSRLLLFVDQFEEIFTVTYPEDEARDFLASIFQLAELERVNVITTTRSEF
jgi:hypothetical protein